MALARVLLPSSDDGGNEHALAKEADLSEVVTVEQPSAVKPYGKVLCGECADKCAPSTKLHDGQLRSRMLDWDTTISLEGCFMDSRDPDYSVACKSGHWFNIRMRNGVGKFK